MNPSTTPKAAALATMIALAAACDLGDGDGGSDDGGCLFLCGGGGDGDGDEGGDPPQPPFVEGDRGRGLFEYACSDGDSDAVCVPVTATDVWPVAIVVGGRFRASYRTDDDIALGVQSAAPELLSEQDGRFTMQAEALVGLVAGTPGSGLVDSVHVRGVALASLSVTRTGAPVTAVTLSVGDALELSATPHGAAGDVLAGALDYAWTSSAPEIVDVASGDATGDLTGLAAGSAIVTVTAGGRSTEVAVTVEEVAP